ncbi:AAA-domain-containing protein, partial [Aureobasidium melanogenum]|uniref:AAA-domain-containing protein n=1 Tax=Aureobasidium melanogenum (strain CBS 110374) TaxID=1043003 RepID=A0A074VSK6_AURM1
MAEVHVEVRLKDADAAEHITRAEIEDAFHTFLTNNDYLHPVRDGELLEFEKFQHKDHVASVYVTGVFTESKYDPKCLFSDVQLKVHAYSLHEQAAAASTVTFSTSKDSQARLINLPHESLAGVWERLKFDNTQNINPEEILNMVFRTVTQLHQANKVSEAMDINRLILFHGPPGCGKSTLCRALAQKLVIRLSRTFRGGKLFEINTQDLLSKFYSESGKLISEMFDKVLRMAHDGKELVCVLIDEIESIATSRQASTKNGECTDTVRATNQLLTALDRIRSKPNIVVFCTSNLAESIDSAFLDRVYDKISVPPPCGSAIYTILSNILNSLIEAGTIIYEPWAETLPSDEEDEEFDFRTLGSFLDQSHLPSYDRLTLWKTAYPQSPGPILMSVAEDCAGLSGREMVNLPFLAIAKYTRQEKCTVFDAIRAIEKAVKVDKATK